MSLKTAVLGSVAMVLSAVVCLTGQEGLAFAQNSPSKYSPALSPDGKLIAYVTEASDDNAIYVMNADGKQVRRLVALDSISGPVWSPDSQQIAYVDSGSNPSPDGSNTSEIDVIDVDGSNKRKLSGGESVVTEPTWSSDSKRIAFVARHGTHQDIDVVDRDGSNLAVLTKDSGNNSDPAWSPDGKQIAFSSDRDGTQQIYVMDANGSNPHRLITTRSADSLPAWSPNGKEIAFTHASDSGTKWYLRIVLLKDAQTTIVLREVQFNEGTALGSISPITPVWSPDGDWIAASITYGMSAHIWLVNSRHFAALDFFGPNQPLYSGFSEARNDSPSWMPDGEHLVFSSNTSGSNEIYSMTRDAQNVRQLTGLAG